MQAQRGLVEVADAVFPGVVTVRAFVRDSGERGPEPAAASGWAGLDRLSEYPGFRLVSAGSGFVVSREGEILTCLHALQQPDGAVADLFEVETQDSSRILAGVVGTEPTVNLAILQCLVFPDGHPGTLTPLRFGDSDAMKTGQWAIGVGDPAGPEKFFAAGTFIARPSRDCYQALRSSFFLQVAMVAHPQAYGGPLVNLDGEVIGVLAPGNPRPGILADEPRFGIEFALPSKVVAPLHEAIRAACIRQSPWLGFSVMSRPELVAKRGLEAFQAMPKPRNGILVEHVFTPSPAAEAGIEPEDFLVSFDGTMIFSPIDFQRCLYMAGLGRPVELQLFRRGETLRPKLTVTARPAAAVPR